MLTSPVVELAADHDAGPVQAREAVAGFSHLCGLTKSSSDVRPAADAVVDMYSALDVGRMCLSKSSSGFASSSSKSARALCGTVPFFRGEKREGHRLSRHVVLLLLLLLI